MPQITFAWADGRSETIEADTGASLMVAAITHAIDGIDGECGGGMVCGTCHIYVDSAWLDRVGVASQAEDEILDGVAFVRPNSRLACQIAVSSDLEGLHVTLPPVPEPHPT